MTDVANGTTQLGLTYGWGSTNNNGNLLTETISDGGLTFNQTFGYDTLNRLASPGDTGGWSRNFSLTRRVPHA